jgi:hypothetical protein
VAVLKHPDNEYELNQWNVIERAAQALGITAEAVTVRSAAQFEEAFATVRQRHPDGWIVFRASLPLHGENFATVAEFNVVQGECVPFGLTHGPSHLRVPAAVDWRAALHQTEAFWRDWSGPMHVCRSGEKRSSVPS